MTRCMRGLGTSGSARFVLDPLGGENLTKSLKVLGRGGKVVGISGPPTPEFARVASLNPILRLGFGVLSRKTRTLAKKLGVSYEFLLMRASLGRGVEAQPIRRS